MWWYIKIGTGSVRITPSGVGKGTGVFVGDGVTVGDAVGLAVGVAVGVAVNVAVGVGVAVGFAVAVGDGVGLGEGVGEAVGGALMDALCNVGAGAIRVSRVSSLRVTSPLTKNRARLKHRTAERRLAVHLPHSTRVPISPLCGKRSYRKGYNVSNQTSGQKRTRRLAKRSVSVYN